MRGGDRRPAVGDAGMRPRRVDGVVARNVGVGRASAAGDDDVHVAGAQAAASGRERDRRPLRRRADHRGREAAVGMDLRRANVAEHGRREVLLVLERDGLLGGDEEIVVAVSDRASPEHRLDEARVADAVSVRVGLVGILDPRAIVDGIRDPVAVAVPGRPEARRRRRPGPKREDEEQREGRARRLRHGGENPTARAGRSSGKLTCRQDCQRRRPRAPGSREGPATGLPSPTETGTSRRGPMPIPSSEITPEGLWLRRRELVKSAALFTATAGGLGGSLLWLMGGRRAGGKKRAAGVRGAAAPTPELAATRNTGLSTDEPPTPFDDVTTYNNFYEFGTDKGDPAAYARALRPRPWTIRIDGEVAKPQTVDVDDLIRRFALEERVYRMRCVEAWSMVIPWDGFPL